MSQANKWGWKALATRMLLTPVLMAGPFAVPVLAQTATKVPSEPGKPRLTAGAPTKPVGTTDPKELLKLGRKALSDGRFDDAQDFARQADANNPQGRWGLLGDTPESLLKDCQSSRVKADKVEAEKLAKEAKDLYSRPAKNEADRAVYLDQAAAKIDRACTLAGPAGFIDELNPFAERPESLKREIDSARGKIRRSVPAPTDARATYATTSTKPATGLPKPTFDVAIPKPLEVAPNVVVSRPVTTNNRPAAIKLMEEGRTLLGQDLILEAKAKFGDANKLNVPFAYNEENPDRGLQDVASKGKEKIDSLVRNGQEFAGRKEIAKAEASFEAALKLAVGLNMRPRDIELELAALKAPKTIVVASAQLPDSPPLGLDLSVPNSPKVPEKIEPFTLPDAPSLPVIPGESKIEAPKLELPKLAAPRIETPKLPELTKPVELAPPSSLPELPKLPSVDVKKPAELKPVEKKPAVNAGRKLIDDAVTELKSGQIETARKLAVQAHNGDFGVKAEAQELLREIDAEMYTAKKKEAAASFKAASESFNAKQYDSTRNVLELIDPALLTVEQAKSHEAMLRMTIAAIAKAKEPVPAAGTPSLTTLVPSTPTPGATNLADQVKALSDVEFQQLRSEGLQAESQALESFKKGETDVAITTLTDFVNKVKTSKLSAARQNLLASAAERRLDTFRIMKKQMDFYTREAGEKREQRDRVVMKSAAEQQKQDEIAKRVQQVNGLLKAQKYREAEALALQTKQLDPENPTIALIYELAKNNRRVNDAKQLKSDKEEMVLGSLNDAERQGPLVTSENPIAIALNRSRSNTLRGDGNELYIKTRTDNERKIEVKLERPLTLTFENATLRETIRKFADTAEMNIVTDDAALSDIGVDLDKVTVSESIKQPISLRNIMQLILEKSGLQYVVEHDVVRVTSMKKAKGRLYTKVFSVMDLVIPIPDFALPEHASLAKALERQQTPSMPWMADVKGTSSISTPRGGLKDGQLVSDNGPWKNQAGFGQGNGVLDNTASALAPGAFLAPTKANHSEQLKRLITGMVRPGTWEDVGGNGKVTYYDIGGALVVNQTADVIKEVQDLLESLRRLQDLSVAVEIRVISLTESFFERIGVDFQMNIKTHNSTSFESGLTTGAFRPEPFINNNNGKGTVGFNPASGITSDLNVPIRPNTYGFSVPPFGGYPGNGNGGLNLGLAFLNDIQVFMFLEASAGDRRVNVMQAPKITLFNGQTSTVSVSDLAYFTLGLQIINVGGQFVYIPQNTPLPIGQGAGLGGGQGVSVTVQAVVSADRRYVRLNLAPQLSALASATVPLFPVTAFITPVFEGGSQGQPIPFTQFFQQPSFTSITVQTTVAVPDGGTVLLGGLKTLEEGRNEFGPPVVSQIPYLNRLFRNTGIGRETRHIMIMVTPRIIITSEEEQIQTGVGLNTAGN